MEDASTHRSSTRRYRRLRRQPRRWRPRFGRRTPGDSDEPGADKRGGDLGKFPKGAMVPEFQAGLEKIKVGEVSDLVETPFGFHVILRTQ